MPLAFLCLGNGTASVHWECCRAPGPPSAAPKAGARGLRRWFPVKLLLVLLALRRNATKGVCVVSHTDLLHTDLFLIWHRCILPAGVTAPSERCGA